jgi:hypothetical protein
MGHLKGCAVVFVTVFFLSLLLRVVLSACQWNHFQFGRAVLRALDRVGGLPDNHPAPQYSGSFCCDDVGESIIQVMGPVSLHGRLRSCRLPPYML